MKKYIHFFLIFLCPLASLFSAEIGVDTDIVELESVPIVPHLSPSDKSDIKGLSHFGAALFIKEPSASADRLLAALAENPHSSRILAFLLKSFRNYDVSNKQISILIAIAKANPRALPLNVAALTLADCIEPANGSSTDLKRTLAENCVEVNNLDKFNEIQFNLFQNIVKTLSTIYLKQKQYAKGDELFERLFASEKLYRHNIFLQQAVIFYTYAAREADKSRRFLWLLPSRAGEYAERKRELLKQLHARSNETREMEKIIRHLTFLQKLELFDEARTMLLEQLARQPARPVLQIALAELFSKQKKYALASTIWQKMVKRNPQNNFFRLKLAQNAFRAELYQLAAENYRPILQASQKSPLVSVIFMFALTELQLGKPDIAWKLLKMLPETSRFTEIRAQVLSVMGKDKRAFEMLSKIILNSPQKADRKLYFFWLALAVKTGDARTQLNCLKTVEANLDAKDIEVANSVGYTYADLNKNLPEAKKLISYALSKKADSPEYLDSMAWVLFRMNNFKQAADYIERAVSKEGKYPNAVLADHAGDIFHALGDRKKALYYWNLALKIFSFDLDKNKIKNKIKDIESK